MKTIYLFRHGEVEAKYQKRFRGVLDCELSDAGRHMSECNAEFLLKEKVDRVITTGLKRADYVGELLKKHGIPHEVRKAFQEANFGDWEGKSWEEVFAKYPKDAPKYKLEFDKFKFPGGESIPELKTRVLNAWAEVLKEDFEKLAIVGHSTTNTCLLSHLKGRPFIELGLQVIGSFHEIEIRDGKPQVKRENVVIYSYGT